MKPTKATKRTKRGSSDLGFTLMEMVVAVFIVGVMTAVAAPVLAQTGKRAKVTASEQNQRTIRAALSEYYLLHNAYPTGNTTEQLNALVSGQLLEEVPVDPSGGTYIITDSDPNNVVVASSVDGVLGAP